MGYYLRSITDTEVHETNYHSDVALYKSKTGRWYRQEYENPAPGMKLVVYKRIKDTLFARKRLHDYCGRYFDICDTGTNEKIDFTDAIKHLADVVGEVYSLNCILYYSTSALAATTISGRGKLLLDKFIADFPGEKYHTIAGVTDEIKFKVVIVGSENKKRRQVTIPFSDYLNEYKRNFEDDFNKVNRRYGMEKYDVNLNDYL